MRDIKFRGKTVDNKRWVYGLLGYCNFNRGVESAIFQAAKLGSIIPERTKANTVGQYTGLKDKNGVEIYEGDIVISCGRKDNPCVVEYNQDRCEFIMRYDGDGILHIVKEFKNSYEVIGNIYDNPELLEVDE